MSRNRKSPHSRPSGPADYLTSSSPPRGADADKPAIDYSRTGAADPDNDPKKPEIDTPSVDTPDSVPETDVPQIDIPEIDLPNVDKPEIDRSPPRAPEIDVPGTRVQPDHTGGDANFGQGNVASKSGLRGAEEPDYGDDEHQGIPTQKKPNAAGAPYEQGGLYPGVRKGHRTNHESLSRKDGMRPSGNTTPEREHTAARSGRQSRS